MPCPTCGCTCCDRILAVEPIMVFAGIGALAGRFVVLNPDDHRVIFDAEPERPLAAELEMLARKAMAHGGSDGRPRVPQFPGNHRDR